jgi:hypothetical protein
MAVVKEYTLNISTSEAQANVEELNASFRAQESLIEGLKSELESFEKELASTTKTEFARRKSLNNKIKETKDKLDEEVDGLKNVTTERKKANKTLKEAEENTADYGGVLGILDAQTGGVISGLGGMRTSIMAATKGLKLMKIAIIGTGIGALLIAITSLGAAFTSSEKGQNQFNKIMTVMGVIMDVFIDRIALIGDILISLFTDPVQLIKDFGNTITEFVMDKIDLAIESLGFMGSAIKKLFSGDFRGALKDAGKGVVGLNRALNPTVMITEALIKSTKNLITELSKEAKIAQQIADQRAKADKLDRQIILDRAKANRDRADLLNKAVDKENFSLNQRIEFLEEAGRLEDEITQKEIEAAQLRLDAKIAENSLGAATKDALDEEVALKAELINLETAKLQKDREVTAQVIALRAEEAAAKVAADDIVAANKKEIDDAEIQRLKELEALKKNIRDATALYEDEKRELELEKIQEHYDALLAQAIEQKITDETILGDIVAAGLKALADKQKQFDDEDLAREEAKAEKEKQLNRDVINAKLDSAKQGFALIGEIAGEGSKLGKAMAIGQATISGYQAVQNAFTTASASPVTGLFPAYPYIQAGLAGAFAAVNIKKIASTKPVGASTPPPSTGGRPATPSIPSAPPEFNTVGASGSNQLADAIGSQTNQPIKTYVVASDVTTAQALDRGIITGATVG